MSQSVGQVVLIGFGANADIVSGWFGSDNVHRPLLNPRWKNERETVLTDLFESFGPNRSVTVLDLSTVKGSLTGPDASRLLQLAEKYNSELLLLTDQYVRDLEFKAKDGLEGPCTTIDQGPTHLVTILQTIKKLLEEPISTPPEMEP